MKKKFFSKEVLQGVGQIGVQILAGFAGQLGALLAVDYYHKLKDEMETKKPIGFQYKK